jgi:predicted TIM-barrel fold metal-dependent hydrolase
MAPTDRREFLIQAAAAVVAGACAVGARAGASEESMLPIVDTHQHLWDLSKFKLPWLKDAPESFRKNHVMSDYLDVTRGLNVVKSVYMEVDMDPSRHVAEAEYVIELCKKADNPMVAAVIGGRPASNDFAQYVARFKDSAYVKGVRQVLHNKDVPAGFCLREPFIKGVRLLGDNGLSFDICVRPGELGDAAKLIDACPGTRFILDHCGNGDVQAKDLTQWKKDMAEVAKRKYVVGKVSGIVVNATPEKWTAADLEPIVKHTIAVFGPDRAMFGGDWPVCTKAAPYRQWVESLKKIVSEHSVDEQRQLFHDNAVRVYGLDE